MSRRVTSTGSRITGPSAQRATGSRRAQAGERLDAVLKAASQAGEPIAVADAEAYIEDLLGTSGDSAEPTLEAQVVDFVMPRISEPSIFRGGRSLVLLEFLRDAVLPVLDDNEELRELALKVIDDEISRQREVLERLQASIVA